MKRGGKRMEEILMWLVVVAACGGLLFAITVTIIYLGHKLKEEEESENPSEQAETQEVEDADTPTANQVKINVADIAPDTTKEKKSDTDEIDMSEIAMEVENTETEASEGESATKVSEDLETADFVMCDFDKGLFEFLENEGYKNENYIVSPASLRSVMGLAIAGADNETKAELLKAAGFSDEAAMNKWYENLVNVPDTTEKNVTFHILNSAWHNTKMPGALSQDYKDYIKAHYEAEAQDVEAGEITDAVNNWVNEGTNGLIPSLSDDLSGADMVLVNTLYLKSSWIREFEKAATEEGDFMSYDGCCIKKEFMDQTDHFKYFEDDKTKILVMTMNGGIDVMYVLGDSSDFQGKLSKATMQKVHVKVPKFTTETSFDKRELVKYLQGKGAKTAFLPEADFSAMSSNENFYITDIIQKTKIVTDENGIEAAASSGMVMVGSALPTEEEEPKEFIADKPFKYYIMTTGRSKEILFYGQVVE
ncbi:serpin family protein [Butyrivibrio sp. AC2005]|uniref:serpin family protein n=1 Tax=Butyrivibrio sp. AC2005 TaxID=1280672 RepID=UPI00040A22D7|nr:serpin family protein [Butyrivibrio sp. AC2005]